MGERDAGWRWFDEPMQFPAGEDPAETERCFARCFKGPDGEKVLSRLKQMTMARPLGPEAGDMELRHLEGQRYLVAQICALVSRGRRGQ